MKRQIIEALSGVLLLSGGSAFAHGTCHEGEAPKKCIERLHDTSFTSSSAERRSEREDRDIRTGRDVRTSYEGSASDAAEQAKREAQAAPAEIAHPREAEARGHLGEVDRGLVKNTVTTDPVAIITGAGINGQYVRPIRPKLSGVAGANFSRVNAGAGSLTNFGGTLGLDYFAIGHNNEGLRIGPRLNFGLGRDDIASGTTFGNVGTAGEVGYNYIADSGITAGAAAGMGVRVGTEPNPDTQVGTRAGVRADPYGKVNIGYSW